MPNMLNGPQYAMYNANGPVRRVEEIPQRIPNPEYHGGWWQSLTNSPDDDGAPKYVDNPAYVQSQQAPAQNEMPPAQNSAPVVNHSAPVVNRNARVVNRSAPVVNRNARAVHHSAPVRNTVHTQPQTTPIPAVVPTGHIQHPDGTVTTFWSNGTQTRASSTADFNGFRQAEHRQLWGL